MNRYWELQDLTYPTALRQMWGPQKIIALPVMLVLGDQLPSDPASWHQNQLKQANRELLGNMLKGWTPTNKGYFEISLWQIWRRLDFCRHHYFGLPFKIATDGSMQQDKRSSFVWTMRLKRTNILISEQSAQCSGPVDGDPVQNSSTRAELFGLALAMPFLQKFIEFHSISTAPPHT